MPDLFHEMKMSDKKIKSSRRHCKWVATFREANQGKWNKEDVKAVSEGLNFADVSMITTKVCWFCDMFTRTAFLAWSSDKPGYNRFLVWYR